MRNTFRGYYPPTDDELEKLWSDGLIVLDTNALLNLFRYTADAREDFFKVLQLKTDSLWIPHQVGLEFHRRRIEVVNRQRKAFTEVEDALSKAQKVVEASLNSYKRHPSLETEPIIATLSQTIDGLRSRLQDAHRQHEDAIASGDAVEATLTTITELYEGRVGTEFTQERLVDLYKNGAARYEKEIPPGYKDKQKAEPARYGDLVLWEQLLEHARRVKLPAIFITDDQKEDWWYIVDSRTHGPRPELVAEYFDAAGERIHFMTPNRFLDFAKARMSGIRSESVTEVEAVSRAREEIAAINARRAREQALLTHLGDINMPESRQRSRVVALQLEHDDARARDLRAQIDSLTSAYAERQQNLEAHRLVDPHSPDAERAAAALASLRVSLDEKFAEFAELDVRRDHLRELLRRLRAGEVEIDRGPRRIGEDFDEFLETLRPRNEKELRWPPDEQDQ